jgi:hypothetical protein
MAGVHAFLAPSAADRWGPDGCSGYPSMAAKYPQTEESEAAREGDAYHHMVTERLRGHAVKVGDIAPNGYPITDEMIEAGADILADAATWIGQGVRWATEQRIEMPNIHPTLNWGTSDLIGCDDAKRVLYVRDNKFGHLYVDAYENWQCIDYAVGAARFFGITIDATWTVDIGIFQPRSYHPDGPRKIWHVPGARFLELADSLAYAARKATEPDAPLSTGPHCDYCEARHACVALMRAGQRGIDVSMRPIPHDLTPAALGVMRTQIARAIDRLEALASGLDAQGLAMVQSGQRVPGWGRKQGMGRERWVIPLDDLFAIGDAFGVDARKPGALTPKQMRDALKKKGIDGSVILDYSETPIGEVKFVPVDDDAAAKIFTKE